jgi:hypothetical protein
LSILKRPWILALAALALAPIIDVEQRLASPTGDAVANAEPNAATTADVATHHTDQLPLQY